MSEDRKATRYRLRMTIPIGRPRWLAPARDTIEEARLDALATGNAVRERDGTIAVLSPAEIARVDE